MRKLIQTLIAFKFAWGKFLWKLHLIKEECTEKIWLPWWLSDVKNLFSSAGSQDGVLGGRVPGEGMATSSILDNMDRAK